MLSQFRQKLYRDCYTDECIVLLIPVGLQDYTCESTSQLGFFFVAIEFDEQLEIQSLTFLIGGQYHLYYKVKLTHKCYFCKSHQMNLLFIKIFLCLLAMYSTILVSLFFTWWSWSPPEWFLSKNTSFLPCTIFLLKWLRVQRNAWSWLAWVSAVDIQNTSTIKFPTLPSIWAIGFCWLSLSLKRKNRKRSLYSNKGWGTKHCVSGD